MLATIMIAGGHRRVYGPQSTPSSYVTYPNLLTHLTYDQWHFTSQNISHDFIVIQFSLHEIIFITLSADNIDCILI